MRKHRKQYYIQKDSKKAIIRSLHRRNRDYYLKKFNSQCIKCSSQENLQLHHIKYEHKQPSKYVILFCRSCHIDKHRELRGNNK